jgi:hypothetical protein
MAKRQQRSLTGAVRRRCDRCSAQFDTVVLYEDRRGIETFEVAKDLDYDVAVLAGRHRAPGRVAARWPRNPARFGGKPIVKTAGNREYYESGMDQSWRRCDGRFIG